MASNSFASGTGNGTVVFEKPVDYLIMYVDTSVTCSISFDDGANYITVPDDWLHTFRIGPVKQLLIQSDGAWSLNGVQA